MARPFKETPILYGEDARRFQEAMDNVKPYTDEQKKALLENVKDFMSNITYSCFGEVSDYRAAC